MVAILDSRDEAARRLAYAARSASTNTSTP